MASAFGAGVKVSTTGAEMVASTSGAGVVV